jgi:hypothetical protein
MIGEALAKRFITKARNDENTKYGVDENKESRKTGKTQIRFLHSCLPYSLCCQLGQRATGMSPNSRFVFSLFRVFVMKCELQ